MYFCLQDEICGKGVDYIKLLSVTFYKLKMMMADRLFFLAMIIIPLLIMVVSGYAFRYEKLDIIPVAAVDEDHSEYSALLLERLSQKEGLDLNAVDREKGMEMLEGSKVEQIFTIKEGFEEAAKRGESEGLIDLVSSPSSYSSGFIQEIVAGEVIRLVMSNAAANSVVKQYKELGIEKGSIFKDEVVRYSDNLWEPVPLMTIDYKELKAGIVTTISHSTMPASSASAVGLITAFIMFYLLFSSGWLVEERVNGTIKRLGAAKGAIAASFKGSVLALFAAGSLQIFLFYTVQEVFFGITLFTGTLSFLLLFAYLLAVIAISLFLSTVLKTPAQLQAGAPILALLTGFAGGCFWNFADMPEGIVRISLLTPQGWALRGINALLLDPAESAEAILPLFVLIAIALILLSVSYIILNKLQK